MFKWVFSCAEKALLDELLAPHFVLAHVSFARVANDQDNGFQRGHLLRK